MWRKLRTYNFRQPTHRVSLVWLQDLPPGARQVLTAYCREIFHQLSARDREKNHAEICRYPQALLTGEASQGKSNWMEFDQHLPNPKEESKPSAPLLIHRREGTYVCHPLLPPRPLIKTVRKACSEVYDTQARKPVIQINGTCIPSWLPHHRVERDQKRVLLTVVLLFCTLCTVARRRQQGIPKSKNQSIDQLIK